MPDVVPIQAGGSKTFLVPKLLLTQEKGSVLESMFEGDLPITKLASGHYYIDVDGDAFEQILDFLRYDIKPSCPVAMTSREKHALLKLYKAATNLGLDRLTAHLQQLEPILAYNDIQEEAVQDAVGCILRQVDRSVLRANGSFTITVEQKKRDRGPTIETERKCLPHKCSDLSTDALAVVSKISSKMLPQIALAFSALGFQVKAMEVHCDFTCQTPANLKVHEECCTKVFHVLQFQCDDNCEVEKLSYTEFIGQNQTY